MKELSHQSSDGTQSLCFCLSSISALPYKRGRTAICNFGKLTRQTVGHQLLGNIEGCCTFRLIAIARGVCGALSSHFSIALFVRGHVYLGPGHTGTLRAIISNSGDRCGVSVTSTYKYQVMRHHCHLSKHIHAAHRLPEHLHLFFSSL